MSELHDTFTFTCGRYLRSVDEALMGSRIEP